MNCIRKKKASATNLDEQEAVKDFEVALDDYFQKLRLLDRRANLNQLAKNKRRASLLNHFSELTDSFVKKGQQLISNFETKKNQEIKSIFRDRIKVWVPNNPFMKRCIEKPRGFSGDYLTLEMMYCYEPVLGKNLKGFFDHYLLNHASVVKSRLRKIESILTSVILGSSSDKPLKILSLGCGPCREWLEIGQRESILKNKKINLTCLDRDEDALKFAGDRLKSISRYVKPIFIQENLFSLPLKRLKKIGPYKMIYGLGIADYFYDNCLTKIISSALELLEPGGTLTISHKDRKKFVAPPSDWLCNWKFVMRDKDRLLILLERVLSEQKFKCSTVVEMDSTKRVIFFNIRKSKGK